LKRLAAISFLLILAFNWLGYRYVFDYLEKKHDRTLESKLDTEDYDESQLISVKTVFPVPYFVSTNTFERWSGEIEIDGILYKYVKRRFFSDSVELLCIPNSGAEQLKSAKHDYFRIANDLTPQSGPSNSDPAKPAFKSQMSEYCEPVPEWDFNLVDKQKHPGILYAWYIPESPVKTILHPPEFS